MTTTPESSVQPAEPHAPPSDGRNGHAALPTEPRSSEDVRRGRTLLLLANVSHSFEHFEKHMLTGLWPVLMAEMGFGYAQLGGLAAMRAMAESGTQGIYGFLAPFARRTKLLALGNLFITLGALLTALSGSLTGLIAARCLGALGSSAQHPVIASLLARYFPPHRRGSIMALNSSLAGVGSLIAPAAAGVLVAVVGWRPLFFVAAAIMCATAIGFLLLPGRSEGSARRSGNTKARLAEGWDSYARVLRNRNMVTISLVMCVGAAGRGAGVNVTFLTPHLVNDLGLSVALAGVLLSVQQLGGVAGPLGFGWLSDRLSRKGVLQASLLLTGLGTLWVAFLGADVLLLVISLFVYGVVSNSRLTLTQALVADTLEDRDRDAAFSVFYFLGFISGPIWVLLAGFLMESFSFAIGFSALALSYVLGSLLMTLVKEPPRTTPPAHQGG